MKIPKKEKKVLVPARVSESILAEAKDLSKKVGFPSFCSYVEEALKEANKFIKKGD